MPRLPRAQSVIGIFTPGFWQMLRDRVRPLFYTRLRLGEFDPPAMNPYNALELSVVQSSEHRNLSLEAAIKSFVLLKNQRDTLPLRELHGKRLAVRAGLLHSSASPDLVPVSTVNHEIRPYC